MTATLFDLQAETPEAPRCRLCARPARWNKVRSEYGAYCSGASCSNRERLCKTCGREFLMNTGEAGTRYCSTACKAAGYHPTTGNTRKISCAWCGTQSPASNYRGGAWPYICRACIAPIKHVVDSLKKHRVSHERAQHLAQHPFCEVCGQNIVLPRAQRGGHKRPLLVVDHDHACCPGDRSCGACVRGMLCRGCNTAIGMLRDDASVIRAAADYIESQSSAAMTTEGGFFRP